MALLGTLWIWVAGVILSETIGRTNWSPLSGMTLIAVTILIVISSGLGDAAAIVSSVMVGAAACVAMAQATDLMLDLKTGYLVGAIPRRQQTAQFLGSWLGPIVIMALIIVLHQAYGMGSERLPAPQGQALASMVSGILGGDVPVDKYLAGAGLGALLSASGVGGLGILVGLGFYLPFNIVLTYSIGTAARLLSDWKLGRGWSEDVGIPVAAGFIVGEALVGVGFALYYIFSGM
jgi:putative OPT family oligopeptide transporter